MFAQELLPKNYDVLYVGIMVLSLAVCGALSKRTRIWVILAAPSAVQALGSLLRVGRDWVEYSVAGKTGFVLLPGALLARLPFYESVGDPARFAELTAFSIAVLASHGVSVLCRIVRRGMVQSALVGGIVIYILLDYSSFFPFPTEGTPIPEFYDSLSTASDDYGTLDVGPGILNDRSLYFQTIHQHPIARGYIYRLPPRVKYYQEFLRQLARLEPDIINAEGFVPILQQLDIRHVVLHKRSDATTEGFMPLLGESLGEPVYEDGQIAAFAVRPSGPTGVREIPFLVLGERWYPIESIDGVPSRWMVNDGTLYVRVEREGPYQLALVAHPFVEPRHLQISVNEDLVEEYHTGGLQSYVMSPFALKSGEWTPIRLYGPEACEVPSEVMVEKLMPDA